VGAEDDGLAALAEFRVERLVGDHRLEAEVERDEAEPVHLRAEMDDAARGVLEMPVSGLAAVAGPHAWHEHAVVVDQVDVAIRHHHVAVLDVAVRDTLALEEAGDDGEVGARLLERPRIGVVLVEPDAERVALDPVHPYDRESLLTHADARRLEIEIDEI